MRATGLTARRDKLRADAVEKAGLNGNIRGAKKCAGHSASFLKPNAMPPLLKRSDGQRRYGDCIHPELSATPDRQDHVGARREVIEDIFVDRAAPELREQLGQIDDATVARIHGRQLRSRQRRNGATSWPKTEPTPMRSGSAEAAFAKALGAAPVV